MQVLPEIVSYSNSCCVFLDVVLPYRCNTQHSHLCFSAHGLCTRASSMLPSTDDMKARFERITASSSPVNGAANSKPSGSGLKARLRAGHEMAALRVREHRVEKGNRKRKQHQHTLEQNVLLLDERERLQLQLTNSIAECRVAQRKLRIMEQMAFGQRGRSAKDVKTRAKRRSDRSPSPSSPSSSTLSSPFERTRRSKTPNSAPRPSISTRGDSYLDELSEFKESLSPHRPSTSSASRRSRSRASSPFRPGTAPHRRKGLPRPQQSTPSYQKMATARIAPSQGGEYGDFKKRIERLKRRLHLVETELSEEKTKGRLLQLRQLTGDTGGGQSETQHNNAAQRMRPAKNGFSGSFWEDIQRDKTYIRELGTDTTHSQQGIAANPSYS